MPQHPNKFGLAHRRDNVQTTYSDTSGWLDARGRDVYSSDGEKIGDLDNIYVDEDTGRPLWIRLSTGFFGLRHVVAPAEGAVMTEDRIQLSFTRDQVKDSPDADGDRLSDETNDALCRYYGMSGTGYVADFGGTAGADVGAGLADYGATPGSTMGGVMDTERTETITRSEEEIRVGKREVEGGRVRLHKWVETEPVSAEVELEQERAYIQREPINEPVTGAELTEQEIEVPLRREEAVVQKDVVGKERISVSKEVESQVETVTDEVRKERVEIEGDVRDRP
jgi:uncharacterized protein (TIGR02271 family)